MAETERLTSKPHLNFGQKLSYSVGHVLNDLTASMWFTYMIIYFHQVKNFDNGLAGDLVLIGQISDAIFTPFIGFESDRTKGWRKLGKRKTWHLIGTICVAASFPFLFVNCITCSNAPDWSQFIYYAPFVIIFQFGWASTQINHLSLIPDLTDDPNERVGLNGSRYAFTVLSNMVVYGIAFVIFEVQHNTSGQLDSSDSGKFRILVLIVVGVGILFSAIFQLGVREHSSESQCKSKVDDKSSILDTIERSAVAKINMTWKCWLKERQFYQVAVIYMCTRLVVNISQVYLPMFITETIKLDKSSIAIIPLVVYVSGFVTSLLMKFINKLVGRKITYILGLVFTIGASAAYYLIPTGSKLVYGAAVLAGIGGSTMLVTSLAMTADLIGENTESGAFVYGAMSFTDKLSNGIAIALIQQFHPCHIGCCPACVMYYRRIMGFFPAGMSIIAFIGLLTLIPVTLGTRRKKLTLMAPVANSNNGQANVTSDVTSISSTETEPLLSGKTTILYKIKPNETISTIPTIGFNVETVNPVKGLEFTVLDVGGQDKIRQLWRHYYQNVEGFIYVVDSADEPRIAEAREELFGILESDEMRSVPFVIMANKQDIPGAMSPAKIVQALHLSKLSNGRKWYIQAACATNGEGIYEGMQELASMVKGYKRSR